MSAPGSAFTRCVNRDLSRVSICDTSATETFVRPDSDHAATVSPRYDLNHAATPA